jgi:hypothetical protein
MGAAHLRADDCRFGIMYLTGYFMIEDLLAFFK